MKKVRVEEAVGMVLAHDLTKIIPGTFKGAAFKKGHVIREEDLEELKNIGKYHVFVVPFSETQLHENEAAARIATAAAGTGCAVAEPLEGKANIRAVNSGLLKVNAVLLNEINRTGEIALVTLHNNTPVKAGQLVAAAKIIPLTVEGKKVAQVEESCRVNPPVIGIKTFSPLRTGIIVTGSEIYYGRIKDRFGETLRKKIGYYGGAFLGLEYAPDEPDLICDKITGLLEKGAEVILLAGGMAVDADDVTPQAIRKAATEVVSYGVPVLPGSMCMIAYCDRIPLVGVPACAMFNQTTVLDLIFPRLLAGERLQKDDLTSLGHGGMCVQCETCRYPACSFGKYIR